jgi:hypothetical protein
MFCAIDMPEGAKAAAYRTVRAGDLVRGARSAAAIAAVRFEDFLDVGRAIPDQLLLRLAGLGKHMQVFRHPLTGLSANLAIRILQDAFDDIVHGCTATTRVQHRSGGTSTALLVMGVSEGVDRQLTAIQLTAMS